jgi:5-(carboxyamino)imidazole ribonucleotide mutase
MAPPADFAYQEPITDERLHDMKNAPLVGVIMGSDSDLPVMRAAADICNEFGVSNEIAIVSAHRTPERALEYAKSAAHRGLKVIIAGAGGAAHLPGVIASLTSLPVIGVPMPLKYLDGLDSLLSIVQMPKGVPVASVGVGSAANAGLLAIRILAASDPALREKVDAYRDNLRKAVDEKNAKLAQSGPDGSAG